MVLVCNLGPSYILAAENRRLLHCSGVFEREWKVSSGPYSLLSEN